MTVRMRLGEVVNSGGRLDRLPLSSFHRRVVGLISAGGLLDTFDVYLAFGVVAALRAEEFSTLEQAAAFISMTFLGMLIGSAIAGYVGDRFGRRFSYQFNLALFGVASFAAALAPNMLVLIVCRFVMGIGLGAELIVAAGTLGEFIPPAVRGRYASVMGLVSSSGLFVSTAVGYLVIPAFGWRAMFVIGGVGAIVVLLLRKQLPESPRWLEAVGRTEEAEQTLQLIEARVQAQAGPLPTALPPVAAAPGNAPLSALFAPALRPRLLAAVFVAVTVNMTVYGLVGWLPTFMVSHGAAVQKTLGLSTIMSIGSIAGSLLGVALSDRIPRRRALIAGGIGTLVFMTIYPLASGDQAIAASGFFLVLSIYFTTNQGMYSYIPEIFPTALRLRGVGFAGMCARTAGMITPYAIVPLLAHFGLPGVLAMVGLVVVGMIAAVFSLKLETRGAPLETIAQHDNPPGAHVDGV